MYSFSSCLSNAAIWLPIPRLLSHTLLELFSCFEPQSRDSLSLDRDRPCLLFVPAASGHATSEANSWIYDITSVWNFLLLCCLGDGIFTAIGICLNQADVFHTSLDLCTCTIGYLPLLHWNCLYWFVYFLLPGVIKGPSRWEKCYVLNLRFLGNFWTHSSFFLFIFFTSLFRPFFFL